MWEFTEEELTKFKGKNGNRIYLAYKRKVYDVSSGFLWKNGKHQVLHNAGMDLTTALDQAPHGEDHIEKVPLIGILKVVDVTNKQSSQ